MLSSSLLINVVNPTARQTPSRIHDDVGELAERHDSGGG